MYLKNELKLTYLTHGVDNKITCLIIRNYLVFENCFKINSFKNIIKTNLKKLINN